MAHSQPLVIEHHIEEGGQTTDLEQEQERTPLLLKKNRQSRLSRLKDHVFVNSKAANMILLWNLLLSLMYGLGMFIPDPNTVTGLSYFAQMPGGPAVLKIIFVSAYGYFAICFLFYPLAGYLGDVRFGRYKTVRCSLWTIWIALLSIVVSYAIVIPIILCTDLMSTPWLCAACSILLGVFFLIAFLSGLAGFRANVIQFGMDQLLDSPARDSSLFIHWFLNTFYFGIGLGKLAMSLAIIAPIASWVMISVAGLTFLLVTPISLCVGHCKRRWFLPTPGIGNPYKQVRRVTNFARKHKIPVHRSAFTYWEEDIPSGLDLGKNKYGGPFTTEQVEDVKAFFGILKVLLSLGPFFMADFAASEFLSVFGIHMGGAIQPYAYPPKYPGFMSTNGGTLYPFFAVFMILLYILTPQRYIQKYTPGMLKRIGIGMVLITISLICSLSLDTAGHTIGNPNATCIFGSPVLNYSIPSPAEIQTLDISPYFLLIQNILTAVAYILIYGGTFEFICAQSPHSMKGFLIGVSFAIKGLFQLLGVLVVFLPFNFWSVSISFPSCGFGYYLVNIVISIIGLIAFTYTAKKYKYRQRDEFCDERRYIEEFYENVVNHNPLPDPED